MPLEKRRHGKLKIAHGPAWKAISEKLILCLFSEAESKEKHGVWDPMPKLTTKL
jgi:hypothetical protein